MCLTPRRAAALREHETTVFCTRYSVSEPIPTLTQAPSSATGRRIRAMDPETWAREHVHVSDVFHGREAVTAIARIEAFGQMFERRADGQTGKGKTLTQRVTDEVVRDYLDFVARSGQP